MPTCRLRISTRPHYQLIMAPLGARAMTLRAFFLLVGWQDFSTFPSSHRGGNKCRCHATTTSTLFRNTALHTSPPFHRQKSVELHTQTQAPAHPYLTLAFVGVCFRSGVRVREWYGMECRGVEWSHGLMAWRRRGLRIVVVECHVFITFNQKTLNIHVY